MKGLFKVAIIFALLFASTFLLARFAGIFSIEQIKIWLEWAQQIDPVLLACIVVLLLFSDLFIAIPTLTIAILSGYFLGFPLGTFSAMLGMYMAGICGYWLTRRFGEGVLIKILKNDAKREEAIASFHKYGFFMIIMSRASPILPEVSACMAGITAMKFEKFILAWTINTVPFALIAHLLRLD
jgi:membrane protein DedA with SNARE-associated domain